MREWIKNIREQRAITQGEIAEQCEISQQMYSAIEIGNRVPSVPTAKKIAAALGFEWQRFYDDAPDCTGNEHN